MNAIVARLADPAPPVCRLAVVALFAAVFEGEVISRAGLAALGGCLSHESEVRRKRNARSCLQPSSSPPPPSTSSSHSTHHIPPTPPSSLTHEKDVVDEAVTQLTAHLPHAGLSLDAASDALIAALAATASPRAGAALVRGVAALAAQAPPSSSTPAWSTHPLARAALAAVAPVDGALADGVMLLARDALFGATPDTALPSPFLVALTFCALAPGAHPRLGTLASAVRSRVVRAVSSDRAHPAAAAALAHALAVLVAASPTPLLADAAADAADAAAAVGADPAEALVPALLSRLADEPGAILPVLATALAATADATPALPVLAAAGRPGLPLLARLLLCAGRPAALPPHLAALAALPALAGCAWAVSAAEVDAAAGLVRAAAGARAGRAPPPPAPPPPRARLPLAGPARAAAMAAEALGALWTGPPADARAWLARVQALLPLPGAAGRAVTAPQKRPPSSPGLAVVSALASHRDPAVASAAAVTLGAIAAASPPAAVEVLPCLVGALVGLEAPAAAKDPLPFLAAVASCAAHPAAAALAHRLVWGPMTAATPGGAPSLPATDRTFAAGLRGRVAAWLAGGRRDWAPLRAALLAPWPPGGGGDAAAAAPSTIARAAVAVAVRDVCVADPRRGVGLVQAVEAALGDPHPGVAALGMDALAALIDGDALSFYGAWPVVAGRWHSPPGAVGKDDARAAPAWARLLGCGAADAAGEPEAAVAVVEALRALAGDEGRSPAARAAALTSLARYPHVLLEDLGAAEPGAVIAARLVRAATAGSGAEGAAAAALATAALGHEHATRRATVAAARSGGTGGARGSGTTTASLDHRLMVSLPKALLAGGHTVQAAAGVEIPTLLLWRPPPGGSTPRAAALAHEQAFNEVIAAASPLWPGPSRAVGLRAAWVSFGGRWAAAHRAASAAAGGDALLSPSAFALAALDRQAPVEATAAAVGCLAACMASRGEPDRVAAVVRLTALLVAAAPAATDPPAARGACVGLGAALPLVTDAGVLGAGVDALMAAFQGPTSPPSVAGAAAEALGAIGGAIGAAHGPLAGRAASALLMGLVRGRSGFAGAAAAATAAAPPAWGVVVAPAAQPPHPEAGPPGVALMEGAWAGLAHLAPACPAFAAALAPAALEAVTADARGAAVALPALALAADGVVPAALAALTALVTSSPSDDPDTVGAAATALGALAGAGSALGACPAAAAADAAAILIPAAAPEAARAATIRAGAAAGLAALLGGGGGALPGLPAAPLARPDLGERARPALKALEAVVAADPDRRARAAAAAAAAGACVAARAAADAADGAAMAGSAPDRAAFRAAAGFAADGAGVALADALAADPAGPAALPAPAAAAALAALAAAPRLPPLAGGGGWAPVLRRLIHVHGQASQVASQAAELAARHAAAGYAPGLADLADAWWVAGDDTGHSTPALHAGLVRALPSLITALSPPRAVLALNLLADRCERDPAALLAPAWAGLRQLWGAGSLVSGEVRPAAVAAAARLLKVGRGADDAAAAALAAAPPDVLEAVLAAAGGEAASAVRSVLAARAPPAALPALAHAVFGSPAATQPAIARTCVAVARNLSSLAAAGQVLAAVLDAAESESGGAGGHEEVVGRVVGPLVAALATSASAADLALSLYTADLAFPLHALPWTVPALEGGLGAAVSARLTSGRVGVDARAKPFVDACAVGLVQCGQRGDEGGWRAAAGVVVGWMT